MHPRGPCLSLLVQCLTAPLSADLGDTRPVRKRTPCHFPLNTAPVEEVGGNQEAPILRRIERKPLTWLPDTHCHLGNKAMPPLQHPGVHSPRGPRSKPATRGTSARAAPRKIMAAW